MAYHQPYTQTYHQHVYTEQKYALLMVNFLSIKCLHSCYTVHFVRLVISDVYLFHQSIAGAI